MGAARMARETPASARIAAAALIGTVCGLVAAQFAAWQAAVLLGWDAAGTAFVLSVWIGVRGLSGDEARRLAKREDPSRAVADLLLLVACVTCLVGVGLTLVKAAHSHDLGKGLLVAVAVASVFVSWTVVHTVFMLRYARLHYADRPGGIEFNGQDAPSYRDFAYVAFTIGMTYQVSDTELTSSVVRATALRHALLSFLFGVVIVGMTINVVAGLLK